MWLKGEGLLVQNRKELANEINPYDANIVEYMCSNISGNVRPIGVLENSFDSLLITDSIIKLGVCVCVCMCMCVCVCAYMCMSVCVHVGVYAHMRVQLCVLTNMHLHVFMHTISKIMDMYDIIEIQDDVITTTTTGGHSYLIKKLIGSGAFANIYLAIDIHSDDKKALKVSD